MILERTVSDLGDFICASVVALVLCLWCWRYVSRLAAAGFAMAFVALIVACYALKLVAADMGLPPSHVGLMELSSGAPSGHMALVTFIYGLACVLFWRSTGGPGARLGFLVSLAIIMGVAVTRVTLHTHSAADVIAGAVLGGVLLVVPTAIVWAQTSARRVVTTGLLPAMLFVAAIALMSGARMSSASFIT